MAMALTSRRLSVWTLLPWTSSRASTDLPVKIIIGAKLRRQTPEINRSIRYTLRFLLSSSVTVIHLQEQPNHTLWQHALHAAPIKRISPEDDIDVQFLREQSLTSREIEPLCRIKLSTLQIKDPTGSTTSNQRSEYPSIDPRSMRITNWYRTLRNRPMHQKITVDSSYADDYCRYRHFSYQFRWKICINQHW